MHLEARCDSTREDRAPDDLPLEDLADGTGG